MCTLTPPVLADAAEDVCLSVQFLSARKIHFYFHSKIDLKEASLNQIMTCYKIVLVKKDVTHFAFAQQSVSITQLPLQFHLEAQAVYINSSSYGISHLYIHICVTPY